MAENSMKKPYLLLDYLAMKCECDYLSDLREIGHNRLCEAIVRILSEEFSTAEWEDAISYLTGEQPALPKDTLKMQLWLIENLRRT